MLKPFQIKNLHLFPAEENLYDSSTESVVSNSHVDETQYRRSGLIHLTGPEYDDIIRGHPNAGLTYLDDDDGDIITVGSSFELEQRLDEPPEASGVVAPVLSNQTYEAPMHLFDIRRSRSVIELWKEVEHRRHYTPDSMTQSRITETNKLLNPSNNSPASEIRELGTKQSVDLHKQWMDACRPPQLLLKEDSEKEPEVPVICDVKSTSVASASENHTSPTIMSLSAITHEGRRQAEEAGNRLHGFRNIPTSSQAVPGFLHNQQNPWASPAELVTETKDDSQTLRSSATLNPENTTQLTQSLPSNIQASQPEAETQPLLSAFEAEMAKILEENARENPSESTEFAATPEAQSRPHEFTEQTWPINLVGGILQFVAGGIENLGSELKLKIPEIERHLITAQRNIPEDVGATMHNALSAVESQIQNLSRVIQNASNASGEAAERVRQAELRSTEQVLSGLGDMAHEFDEFGKTLFAAFETEFGRGNNSNGGNVTDPITSSTQDLNSTQSRAKENKNLISTNPLDQNIKKETPLAEADTSRESAKKSQEAAAVESPIASYQRPPPPHPTSILSSQTSSKPIANNQPQVAGLHGPAKPLFSNWPNRPAFVSSSIPTVSSPTSFSHTNPTHVQPSGPILTDRQPASSPERVNTWHPRSSVTSLFMGNIGFQVTERVIEEVFASKGFSVHVHLPIDSSTGKHAGFGYARFQSASSAKAALDTLQGIIIDGHSLNLEYSDSSPIDGLQTEAPTSQPTRLSSNASINRRAHYRHSWQPSTQRVREHRLPFASSSENLPSVFSGNARSSLSRPVNPNSIQGNSLVEGGTSQNHPEESPEFAARYPSLLPTFRSQEGPVAVPERSMTLSPNSEIARFPPVSQLDAHLLANQNHSGNRMDSGQGLPGSNAAPPLAGVGIQRAATSPISYQPRGPRRTASNINRRSSHEFSRDNAHGLRRRATEALSLRHRAHENASRETRPSGLDGTRTRTLPGSFPVDDATIPATSDNDDSSDGDMRTAIQRSIIDNCVDNLINFGYGTQVDGGRQRLSIYAEAAEGKLAEAIDMIEEEKTAYERYMPNA